MPVGVTLAREISFVPALKILALVVIRWTFFSPGNRVEVHADAMADKPGPSFFVPAQRSPGRDCHATP